MSEAQSALKGQSFAGLVTVQDAGLHGMITLRGKAGDAKLKKAVKNVTGLVLPDPRGIVSGDGRGLAWMSPDEWLVMVAYDEAHGAVEQLREGLADTHHMVENVSDARAVFVLRGEDATLREVLAKLAPADLHPDRFSPGEMRRTRLAQVPAALWLDAPGEAHVVCFRSVGRYVFDLLCTAAAPGSKVGYFSA